ncbi:MAG: hypothetical protein ACI82Z_001559 [Cellvibrionaceae bacterium]|jgi:hypothetical protein
MVKTNQQKNIIKTVVIIVVFMSVMLLLFLNKITKPRYLSDIELKINGLYLLKDNPVIVDEDQQWRLLVANAYQRRVLSDFLPLLKNNIRRKTKLMTPPDLLISSFDNLYSTQDAVGIINTRGQLVGYFKAPFSQQKMILTYSSLVTHR